MMLGSGRQRQGEGPSKKPSLNTLFVFAGLENILPWCSISKAAIPWQKPPPTFTPNPGLD